jgi:KaiC/GvpD/RAD55 family RecA-like ATPase
MGDLKTGIEALDRQLDGGFASGSLVALVTPPEAPSGKVLHQVMRQRPTTYITTLRPRTDLETELMRLDNDIMDIDIQEVGDLKQKDKMLHSLTESNIYSANISDRDRVLDEVNDIIESVDGNRNVIIDPMNPLEATEDKTAYQRVLRKQAAKLRDVNGLGLLHCYSYDQPPALRERTLATADAIWNLNMGTNNDGDLALRTTIPKNRGGTPIFEKLTLMMDKRTVYTDISRGI